MRKVATAEAMRLYDLHTKGALTLPVLFSTLMRVQSDAYAQGLQKAAEPMLSLSQDIDRRMALLDGLSENLTG